MATHAQSIFNFSTEPDATGNAVFEDSNANAGIDRHPHLILALQDTATKIGVRGSFNVPHNYVSTPKLRAKWLTTATSGNALFDFDYVTIADGETYDPAADTENATSGLIAAPGTARLIKYTEITLAANFTASDQVQYFFGRDGVNETSGIAATVYVVAALFVWNDV